MKSQLPVAAWKILRMKKAGNFPGLFLPPKEILPLSGFMSKEKRSKIGPPLFDF
jgi:hypothetical protein